MRVVVRTALLLYYVTGTCDIVFTCADIHLFYFGALGP